MVNIPPRTYRSKPLPRTPWPEHLDLPPTNSQQWVPGSKYYRGGEDHQANESVSTGGGSIPPSNEEGGDSGEESKQARR
jgi:hypothetical protein